MQAGSLVCSSTQATATSRENVKRSQLPLPASLHRRFPALRVQRIKRGREVDSVTFSRQTRCPNANYSCFLAQSATLGDYCSTIMLLLTNLAPSQAEGSELAGQWIAGSNFFRCWRRCHQGIPGGSINEADCHNPQILPFC